MYEGKAIFHLNENAVPVFKPKRSVAFAVVEDINKELDTLETLGVILLTDYSEWPAAIVYLNKKNNNIRVCTDFSIDLSVYLTL